MLQLKPPSTVNEYEWIYPFDGALDRDAEDFEDLFEVATETGDYSNVPMVAGQQPSVFTLRQLRPDERAYVMDQIRTKGQNQAAFTISQLGLIQVANVHKGNGRPLEIKTHAAAEGRTRVELSIINDLETVAPGISVLLAERILRGLPGK